MGSLYNFRVGLYSVPVPVDLGSTLRTFSQLTFIFSIFFMLTERRYYFMLCAQMLDVSSFMDS